MQKIAISGLNASDNPASGVAVAKSLKDEFEIIGLSYNPNESGNYLDFISKSYLMPYPSFGIDALLLRLKEIQKKEKIVMIIPCLDAELPLYIKYQESITNLGIKLVLPNEKNFELRNKNRLHLLSTKLDISYPKTEAFFEIQKLEEIENHFTYPVMIKGNYYNAYKSYNQTSSHEYAKKICNEWGFPLLVQEVIYGDELNLVGLGDGKGNLMGAVSIKKLTTTELGKVWTAVSIEHNGLLKVAKKFVAETLWRGAFELECMVNKEKMYLIEINPRFPSWVYFATALDINMPKQLVKMANGNEIKPQLSHATGKMYIRFTDELITDFSDFSTLMMKKEL